MQVEILQWLITWFGKNTNLSEDQIQDNLDTNYFQEGWIDSFRFIMFISNIEEHFEISFSNDNFQDRSFSTIHGIEQVVRRLLNEKQ